MKYVPSLSDFRRGFSGLNKAANIVSGCEVKVVKLVE